MVSKNHTATICPVCRSPDNKVFLEITRVPVHCNLLWKTRNDAVDAPKSDITLAHCENCGHIFNRTFDPEVMRYTQQYENSLHFSLCFQNYAKELVDQLITSHDLYKKNIIEIGCGKGEFLKLLCETGSNKGIGFDPSYEIIEQISSGTGPEAVTFIKDYYSKRYSSYKADFICCRQVLEHIKQPYDFLADLHETIGEKSDTVIFFEVPNADYTLNELGIWDLIYEHISYFSKNSLARLFGSCGFSIIKLAETFNGQFLCIEAVPGKALHGTENPLMTRHNVELFAEKFRAKIETWSKKIDHIRQSGQKAVLWGAGSKGVTFLNMINSTGQIEIVIDINPRKQGNYIPGTGQKILPPEFLREYRPDVVLVMNSIYTDEIQHIMDRLGVSACMMNV